MTDNYTKRAALEKPIVEGDVEYAKELIKREDIDKRTLHLIFCAAIKHGHLQIVEQFLSTPRIDPSDYFNLAIISASSRGHLPIVDLLLKDPRVDPSDEDNDAISFAASNGNISVVKRLLEDPRVDPLAAINAACESGCMDIVEAILADRRAASRFVNKKAIRFAEESAQPAIVKLLMSHNQKVTTA